MALSKLSNLISGIYTIHHYSKSDLEQDFRQSLCELHTLGIDPLEVNLNRISKTNRYTLEEASQEVELLFFLMVKQSCPLKTKEEFYQFVDRLSVLRSTHNNMWVDYTLDSFLDLNQPIGESIDWDYILPRTQEPLVLLPGLSKACIAYLIRNGACLSNLNPKTSNLVVFDLFSRQDFTTTRHLFLDWLIEQCGGDVYYINPKQDQTKLKSILSYVHPNIRAKIIDKIYCSVLQQKTYRDAVTVCLSRYFQIQRIGLCNELVRIICGYIPFHRKNYETMYVRGLTELNIQMYSHTQFNTNLIDNPNKYLQLSRKITLVHNELNRFGSPIGKSILLDTIQVLAECNENITKHSISPKQLLDSGMVYTLTKFFDLLKIFGQTQDLALACIHPFAVLYLTLNSVENHPGLKVYLYDFPIHFHVKKMLLYVWPHVKISIGAERNQGTPSEHSKSKHKTLHESLEALLETLYYYYCCSDSMLKDLTDDLFCEGLFEVLIDVEHTLGHPKIQHIVSSAIHMIAHDDLWIELQEVEDVRDPVELFEEKSQRTQVIHVLAMYVISQSKVSDTASFESWIHLLHCLTYDYQPTQIVIHYLLVGHSTTELKGSKTKRGSVIVRALSMPDVSDVMIDILSRSEVDHDNVTLLEIPELFCVLAQRKSEPKKPEWIQAISNLVTNGPEYVGRLMELDVINCVLSHNADTKSEEVKGELEYLLSNVIHFSTHTQFHLLNDSLWSCLLKCSTDVLVDLLHKQLGFKLDKKTNGIPKLSTLGTDTAFAGTAELTNPMLLQKLKEPAAQKIFHQMKTDANVGNGEAISGMSSNVTEYNKDTIRRYLDFLTS